MKTLKTKLPLSRLTLYPLSRPELSAAHGGQEPVKTIVLPSDACGVPY